MKLDMNMIIKIYSLILSIFLTVFITYALIAINNECDCAFNITKGAEIDSKFKIQPPIRFTYYFPYESLLEFDWYFQQKRQLKDENAIITFEVL
jgi:hypothetical protein